jgi:hypothetical protein
MRDTGKTKRLRKPASRAAASLLALGLAAAPLGLGLDGGFELGSQPAFAKGGQGGGNGGGNGNGGGGKGGGTAGGAASGGGDADGDGGGKGKSATAGAKSDFGKAKGQAVGTAEDGATANQLGKLNAAHASEQGLSHASINSVVGKLGALMDGMEGATDNVTADSLGPISNKEVNDGVVSSVQGLLSGKVVNRAATSETSDSSGETDSGDTTTGGTTGTTTGGTTTAGTTTTPGTTAQ